MNRLKFFWFAFVFAVFSLTLSVVPQTTKGQGSPRGALDDHRVLLIGDSQVVGPFGRELGYQLISKGVTHYYRTGQAGWGVPNWLNARQRVRNVILQHRPTLLLIELGGNDWFRSARERYEVKVRMFWFFLNEQMRTAHQNEDIGWRIVWIAPAHVGEPRGPAIQSGRDRAARTIQRVVTDRNFVESADVTRDITSMNGRSSDGIHFTLAGGHRWVQRILPRIEACLNR